MSEKKISERPKVRRHKKSEIHFAMFLFQASYQGHHQDINEVLNSDKIKKEKKWLVLNARDAEGMPILINCLKGSAQVEEEKDHLECIKILVTAGAALDNKDANDRTAIHWSILLEKFEICKYLLQQGAETNFVDSGNLSPIQLAVGKKSQRFVQLLCDFGSNTILNGKDSHGRTPLCNALLSNSIEVFEQLLIAGCKPNETTNDGKSLIVYAVEKNLKDFLEILLRYKASLYPPDLNSVGIVHVAACQKEDTQMLNIFAKYCSKSDMESFIQNGRNPLMLAVEHGLLKNVQTLLEKKVNPRLQDAEGNTALHFTNRNSSGDIVNALLNYDPELLKICNKYHRYAINNAVTANNQIVVRALLDHGADTNVLDNEGHTLIHYAAEYSSVDCLAELVSVGLSLNVHDQHGVYPIHYAVRLDVAESGNTSLKIEFLKKLVATGVDLSVMDDRGLKPIHWAVCMGFLDALKLMIIENAGINSLTRDEQYSPLHLACNSQQFECLELLLSQPCIIIDQVDNQGRTPLYNACCLKDARYTEALLNAGANPDHQDKEGKTPAHIAATNSTVDCLWLLSLKKVHFDVKNNKDETPIHLACKNSDDACVRFLLTRKCNVNATQKNGLTALHIAVMSKNSQRVDLLLQNGAKWNQIFHGEYKMTPLDVALENGDYKCVKVLQRYGARTAHSIHQQAVITIQHAWKRHRKNKAAENGVKITNSSSIYTSSNASESVSTKDVQNTTERSPNTPPSPERLPKEPKMTDSLNGNESSEMTLHFRNGGSVVTRDDDASINNSLQNGSSCSGCPEIPQHFLYVLSEKSRREFQERITQSDREITLMSDLMKETEQLLVRAKCVTEEADSIANSASFRSIKKANKEYMELKRKKQNLNGKNKLLDMLIEEYPP